MNDEFKERLDEWLELKKQLKEITADTKLLKNREKELASYIKTVMSQNSIDMIKSEKQHTSVTHSIKQVKAGESVKSLKERLFHFFEARNQINVFNLLMTYLEESRGEKQVETIRTSKSS